MNEEIANADAAKGPGYFSDLDRTGRWIPAARGAPSRSRAKPRHRGLRAANAKTKEGLTALDLARKYGHTSVGIDFGYPAAEGENKDWVCIASRLADLQG
jgi:hypothetical protein